jgi:molybdopterin-containing oxidoreductase family iron-sulfur binding subunit
MKTIPPPCPAPETGQKYWRSLDQLADTPEFRQWAEREFPNGASEFTDGQSRRDFVKLMSASFVLGGLGILGSGCRRPEAQILPFSRQPEGYIHGVPQYFATAMPTRASAIPLLVKSNDGRPTKIEGNPEHPDSNGATDAFAQASILSLYDPDRAQRFAQDGNAISKERALL